jgi:hypothetical protein
MFKGAECSREQTVLTSKIFLGAKYEPVKCAKKQSDLWSKVCVSLLCPQKVGIAYYFCSIG